MDFILMDVCRTGDVDRLNAAISEAIAMNQRGTAGETLLHWAAEGGQIEIIKLLLQQPGMHVDIHDYEQATPLHWACQENHRECAEFLLSVGANVNSMNLTGDTPLHLACFEGGSDCVRLLAEKGADINVQDETGYTPLHAAILNGRKECAQILMSKGANYNLADKTSKTARQLAYDSGLFNKLDFLFETRQEIIDMYIDITRQNTQLQNEKTVLQNEINRLKGFLQQSEAFTKNKQSLQAVHQAVSGIEKLLQDCLFAAADTKNNLQVQIQ